MEKWAETREGSKEIVFLSFVFGYSLFLCIFIYSPPKINSMLFLLLSGFMSLNAKKYHFTYTPELFLPTDSAKDFGVRKKANHLIFVCFYRLVLCWYFICLLPKSL